MGPQQGRKVFTLQTLPDESDSLSSSTVGETAGFSLHAGVATKANERAKLERLCRYITRRGKILTHLNEKAVHTDLLPQCRAPPGTGFLSEAQRFAGRDRGRAGL
jgi:hypothetical protein